MAYDLPALRIVNARPPRPCKKCSFRHKFRRHPPNCALRPLDGPVCSMNEEILTPEPIFVGEDRSNARKRGKDLRNIPAALRFKDRLTRSVGRRLKVASRTLPQPSHQVLHRVLTAHRLRPEPPTHPQTPRRSPAGPWRRPSERLPARRPGAYRPAVVAARLD